MAEPVALLPQNAKSWELAHEITDALRWDLIDPQWIVRQTEPMTCDPAVLPVIAWERSVDLWYDDWSLERKRHVAANWYAYERLKGKVEGYRQFFALVGSTLKSVTAPLQEIFPEPGWTDAEREAFLAQFCQIRIYPLVPVIEFNDGLFLAAEAFSDAFVNDVAPTPYSVTIDTVVREARLFDPRTAQETALTRREMVEQTVHFGQAYQFEDVILPAVRDGLYVNDYLDQTRFLAVDDAPERIIRAAIERPYEVAVSSPQWSTVVPDGKLISIRPDLIREPFDDVGPFLDAMEVGLGEGCYLSADLAWQHIYERFYLYDRERDRDLPAGEGGSYVGHAQLGIPPFTADLKVEVLGQRDPDEFADYPDGYLIPDDLTRLERTLEATRACMSDRDTIYLITQTRRERRFGDFMTFGEPIIFGEFVED